MDGRSMLAAHTYSLYYYTSSMTRTIHLLRCFALLHFALSCVDNLNSAIAYFGSAHGEHRLHVDSDYLHVICNL